MTPDQHALAKEIFLAVLATPESARPDVVAQRCGNDALIRAEVERLLSHHQKEATPAAPPADSDSQTTAPAADPEREDSAQKDIQVSSALEQAPAVPLAPKPPDQTLEPGDMVADRYRIVNQLGSGGMGVVYRADDLKLNQPVAIKFMAAKMAANPALILRFYNEARLARKVTHPNVCRVHDIGEADGRQFLTMEYVEGEDLRSLLRRIGRLPSEKAASIARQMCAGLAAAHSAGVLHRDLKPANIMLDQEGRVRITDFGIAALSRQIQAHEIRAGTPAYMAPEQIAGREVSERSDLYSLGLVIYELFCGRPAFEAGSAKEYLELHAKTTPPPMSELVTDIPASVEDIVDRCLRKDPRRRPSSALMVAAALPGTDVLSLALAADQTPQPELVAAAMPPRTLRLSRRLVAICAAACLAVFALLRTASPLAWDDFGHAPPPVLAERARQVLVQSIPGLEPHYQAFGYCDEGDVQSFLVERDLMGETLGQSLAFRHPGTLFWLRQSPIKLTSSDLENIVLGPARVQFDEPALSENSALVVLDLSGRLLFFSAAPAFTRRAWRKDSTASGMDWSPFLKAAGLDGATPASPEPTHRTTVAMGETVQWRDQDSFGNSTDDVIATGQAELANPSIFIVHGSPDPAAATVSMLERRDVRRGVTTSAVRLLSLIVSALAIPWAWRGFRAGIIDRDGALRLALLVFLFVLASKMLRTGQQGSLYDGMLFLCVGLAFAAGLAALLTVFFVAVDHFARKNWPHLLITWNRLFYFRWRDSYVREHILLGVGVGVFWATVKTFERALVAWLNWPGRPRLFGERVANRLLGGGAAIAGYLDAVPHAIFFGLLFVLLVVALRKLIGRPIVAGVLAGVVITPLIMPRAAHMLTAWLFLGPSIVVACVWVTLRFGLLALTSALFIANILNMSPITLNPRMWYASQSYATLAVVFAILTFCALRLRTDSAAFAHRISP